MAVDIFKPFSIPVSGETFRCISSDENLYVFEWIVDPKGYVPFEHIHLYQDEIFHVKEGELKLVMNGKEYLAKPGDTVTVPKGAAHVAFNNSDNLLKCEVKFNPAYDYFQFAQCFAGLIHDKDYDKKGKINIPKMGYFLKLMKSKSMTRPTEIPAPVFGLALSMFYLMGIIRGWKKDFVRYTK